MPPRNLFVRAVLGAVLVLPGAALAQNVDEIVEKHVAARGGLERLRAVQTMKISRSLTTLGSNLKVVVYKKRPSLFRSEATPEGRPATVRGLGRDGLWEVQGGKLLRRPDSMAVELAELDADIDGMLVDHRLKGHRVEYDGRGIDAGVDVHKLKVTLRSGAVRYVYLDASTYLERKQFGRLTLAPDRVANVEIRFGDYREVSGVMLPFSVDEERDVMGQNYSFYTDAIEVNVPVDDALFAAPADGVR